MEVTFQELRQEEVVSVETGARLGRICDLSFNFKSGCVLGFILPGKGFFFREDLFIPLSGVEKIGEDVVFVTLPGENPPISPKKPPCVPPFVEDCEE